MSNKDERRDECLERRERVTLMMMMMLRNSHGGGLGETRTCDGKGVMKLVILEHSS